jgi:dUTP pyrophosphatase
MNKNIQRIKKKLFESLDLNNDYSHKDFLREFSGLNKPDNSFNFVNKSNNEDPAYESSGAAGFDLRAFIPEPIVLDAGKRVLIKTGLFFEIPEDHEIQIRPRSGLALKHGITVLNSPGTIDSDYRGEIGIIIINLGGEPFRIESGDRIAQGVIAKTTGSNYFKLTKVDSIDLNTERSDGGFGSTGMK